MLSAIRRELGAIIAKLHKLDLGKSLDVGGGGGHGASTYMKDLVEKINFIKSEVLAKFNVGDLSREWYVVSRWLSQRHCLTTYYPSPQDNKHSEERPPNVCLARVNREAAG